MIELPAKGRLFLREQAGPTPDAPTVLLLHGLTANADLNWFVAYEPLGQHFHVLAPDLRGHADGIQPPRVRLADIAEDLAVLLGRLETGPVIVVGFSMGGAVAQLLWKNHRSLVAGLVLCATAADYTESGKAKVVDQPIRMALATAGRVAPGPVRAKLVSVLSGGAADRMQSDDTREEPIQQWAKVELQLSDPLQVASASVAVRHFRSNRWISDVRVPTAMIITTRDVVVPTERQRALAVMIPDVTTLEIDTGHGAFIEDTDAFVPALLSACQTVQEAIAHAL